MNKINKKNIILPISLIIYMAIIFVICQSSNIGIAYNKTKSIDHSFFITIADKFPSKNEYVVFKKDNNFYPNDKWIKLIIGSEGDVIKNIIKKRNNIIIINDYILPIKRQSISGQYLTPITESNLIIKKNEYFVTADHEYSLDSRYKEIGLINKSHIIGKATPIKLYHFLIFLTISVITTILIYNLLLKKKIQILPILILFLINPNISNAKDLGIHGEIYQITEKNILIDIKDKLSTYQENGKLEELQNNWKKQTIKRVNRPKSHIDLPRATRDNIIIHDPSITVNRDIADHNGLIFAKKGTKINPLNHKALTRTLVFINGDDSDQVEFAVNLYDKSIKEKKSNLPMIILTKGNIMDLMKKYKIRLYFDQNAYLSKNFELRFLPSVISQNGDKMQINEIGL
jgi:conjugal transfer pilus assembly protein TraW